MSKVIDILYDAGKTIKWYPTQYNPFQILFIKIKFGFWVAGDYIRTLFNNKKYLTRGWDISFANAEFQRFHVTDEMLSDIEGTEGFKAHEQEEEFVATLRVVK